MSIEVSQEVRDLANTYKDGMTLAAASNGAGETAKKLWLDSAPEGVTEELYLKLNSHIVNSAAAFKLAGGEMGIEAMKLDKALERVTFELPTVGKDKFTMSIDRSTEVVIPSKDGVAGTKTVYGRAKVSFDQYGMGKRGQIAAVKNALTEKATADLGY